MPRLTFLVTALALVLMTDWATAHPGHDHASDLTKNVSLTKTSDNEVKIEVRGKYRYITSNGLPNHEHGAFPNRNNPNRLRSQRHSFRVPAEPKIANKPTPLTFPNEFGVGINGVPFDPGAAEFWRRDRRSGWQYEPMSGAINLGLDSNNAHVQPTGAYHYHGVPVGLIRKLSDGKKQMTLVGYAADGFPIYGQLGYTDPEDAKSKVKKVTSSYKLKSGTRPAGNKGPGGKYDGTYIADWEYAKGAGDLDECNGRFGITPEYPKGIYHYYVTAEFPFIPRQFKGTPDQSFIKRGPPPGGFNFFRGPPPPGGRPPQGPLSGGRSGRPRN